METQCLGGTGRTLDAHCWTVGGETPTARASADFPLRIRQARMMGGKGFFVIKTTIRHCLA